MTTGKSTHSHQVTVAGVVYSTNAKAHTHSETADPDAPVIAVEVTARKAADDVETAARKAADEALLARIVALEAGTPIPPPVTPPVTPPSGKVVPFPTTGTAAQLQALLRDNTIDVITLAGDYHLPYCSWNIERTRPVTMQGPATFHGDLVGGDPQFGFGFGGATGLINMADLTFDGYILAQQGIFQLGDGCHDMTLSRISVRNSRCDGSYAKPYHSWAMYAVGGKNISLPGWNVVAANRQMSALAVDGGDNIKATGWTTRSVHFAAHINPSHGPITNMLLDTWTIDDCGSASAMTGISVQMENSSGTFKNIHATNSGGYTNVGSPKMTDGGGNSWSVSPPPVTPPPVTTATYGPAIGIDGIGNTQVGGPNGSPTRQVAYRFRAKGSLTEIQFCTTNGAGYWGGTGGMLEFSIQADSGGRPSGTKLATTTYKPPNVAGNWPRMPFVCTLTAGQLYHVVFRNTDPAPATNYPSLNNLYMSTAGVPRCPKWPDSDWAELYTDNGTSWTERPDYIPTLALYYSDGTIDGSGYVYRGQSLTIAGLTETFTPKADRAVTQFGMRIPRNLTATIGGTTLTLNGTGWVWVPYVATLKAGTAYNIVLGGSGSMYSMYKGTGYGNWPPVTHFADGSLVGKSDQDIAFCFR